jgi:heavy metal response regulator
MEVIAIRILIIEDELALQKIISKRLVEKGYSVDSCDNGEDGRYYIEMTQYDCIILDLMLPKVDGLTLLKEMRQKGNMTPVLILTAKTVIEDRVAGLDSGADDYLTKPFSFDELLARIRVLLRRQGDSRGSELTFADLTMDVAGHIVKRGNKIIGLTSKEYALLEYFMRNKGRTLSRMQIAEHVWNYDFDCSSNIVDVYIRYLRAKIDDGFENKLLHTIRGAGYVLREKE